MKQFELDILSATFKRCFGLAHCITDNIRGCKQELANQTGVRLSFIEGNFEEIKRFAKVRVEVLNPS
jgi:hypothetical protein